MGGWAKHAWILCPSLPAKKSAFAFLQKIFGLNLHSASKIFRHGASSLRGASRRAPKSRFFRPLPAPCSSIRISSYLIFPELVMSRAPRAWWLCTGVVRFDFVPAPPRRTLLHSHPFRGGF